MTILAQINLFGILPEPVLMLIFGGALIAFTGALRWVFNRNKNSVNDEFSAGERGAQRKSLKEKLS
ncbi:MAG TPA: hypothetical protein VF692_02495 [Pyrinomonadaceae bacterium]|jgi:hypothetical protein